MQSLVIGITRKHLTLLWLTRDKDSSSFTLSVSNEEELHVIGTWKPHNRQTH